MVQTVSLGLNPDPVTETEAPCPATFGETVNEAVGVPIEKDAKALFPLSSVTVRMYVPVTALVGAVNDPETWP